MASAELRLHLEPLKEGGYGVTSPDFPALVTQGDTVEDCLYMAEDCASLLYEVFIEDGDKLPPAPEGLGPAIPVFEFSIEFVPMVDYE